MPKGKHANISLWWYAKVPNEGWRHFPCVLEKNTA